MNCDAIPVYRHFEVNRVLTPVRPSDPTYWEEYCRMILLRLEVSGNDIVPFKLILCPNGKLNQVRMLESVRFGLSERDKLGLDQGTVPLAGLCDYLDGYLYRAVLVTWPSRYGLDALM